MRKVSLCETPRYLCGTLRDTKQRMIIIDIPDNVALI